MLSRLVQLCRHSKASVMQAIGALFACRYRLQRLEMEQQGQGDRMQGQQAVQDDDSQPSTSSSPASFVILHSVSKRHNVGTIARCCTAFGVKQVGHACFRHAFLLAGGRTASSLTHMAADVPGGQQRIQHVWWAWQ
jgi:hypothetical protein